MAEPVTYEVTHALAVIRQGSAMPGGEQRLLTYVVEETLAGREDQLTQKTIAEAVFGRYLPDFDPRADSIVRTTAANLRVSLAAYYQGPGQGDSVLIELPRGTYAPRFTKRMNLSRAGASRLWSARAAIEQRSVTGYKSAIGHLDAVLADAPDFGLAMALKAEALASAAIHGARPRPNLEEARKLADRALGQETPVWQAWLARAIVVQSLEWNWAGAEAAYERALAMPGSEAGTSIWYLAFLVGRGKAKEAALRLQQSVDQFGYSNQTVIGDLSILYLLAREYESAEVSIRAALEAAPGYYQHHMHLAILREALGDPKGAVKALDETPLKLLDRPVTWSLRGLFAGLSGDAGVARRRLGWLRSVEKTGKYVPANQFALCALGMGDCDLSVRYMERAVEERDPLNVWTHAYPFCRHLYGHGGFRRLVDRLGLVWY